MLLWELLRLPDGLANRSFVNRTFRESNWSPIEQLAKDQSQFGNTGLFYFKKNQKFLNVYFKNLFICKILSVKVPLANTHGCEGTAQTFKWPCEPIILSIGHFDDPTEVQLSSWWKAAILLSRSSQEGGG